MRLLRIPSFVSVALGHFAVDALSALVGLLLAAMATPLHLSNASIGFVAMLFSMLVALSQPIFGLISDKVGETWAIGGGVVWMAGFFSLAFVLPGRWAILAMLVAAPGSGAFHPSGAVTTTRFAALHLFGEAATATSLFFFFGQAGFAIGPALGGLVLDHLGTIGLLSISVPATVVGLLAARLNWRNVGRATRDHSPAGRRGVSPHSTPDLTLLVIVVTVSGLRQWAESATTTFVPKLFHDLGLTASYYGLMVGLFMAGMALGGVVGGVLGDRWGMTRTVSLSLAIGSVTLFLFPMASGLWISALLLLSGFFNGAPHGVLVTLAQRAIPGKGGLVTGIALGLTFALGTVGAALTGVLADSIGLARALQTSGPVCLIAAAVSLAIGTRESRVLEVEV